MESLEESSPVGREDIGWHDYVISMFDPRELIDGNPTVPGLRRIVGILLGQVVCSRPVTVFPAEREATVVYEVVIKTKDGDLLTFGDVADVWHGNTDALFVGFAPATACTRAEGRCLRKALGLRGVAAEELPAQKVQMISDQQLDFIDSRCKKLDIDVLKFISSGTGDYRSIYEVTKDIATKMIKQLNVLKNDGDKIKDTIQPYISWR